MHIYKVFFSEKDSLNLSGREAPAIRPNNNVDFMSLVVDKPWGYEYMVCTNPYTQVWSLYIKKDAITSMHAHPNKRTALIVLQGETLFSTLNTSIQLKALDSVMVDTGVFHSTRAVSKEGAYVIEVESPPLKYDLIRLKDNYGREGKLYEGLDHMHGNENGCVRFYNLQRPEMTERQSFHQMELSVKKISKSYTPADIKQFKEQDLMVVLEGNVHSKKGQLLHTVVDVIERSDFINNLDSHVINNLTLFMIKSKKTR